MKLRKLDFCTLPLAADRQKPLVGFLTGPSALAVK